MVAMPPSVTIRCPACADEIELPIQTSAHPSGPASLIVDIDTRPIRAHAHQHEPTGATT